jgi:hypothetical protein
MYYIIKGNPHRNTCVYEGWAELGLCLAGDGCLTPRNCTQFDFTQTATKYSVDLLTDISGPLYYRGMAGLTGLCD